MARIGTLFLLAFRRLRQDTTRTVFTLLSMFISVLLISSILIVSSSFTTSLQEVISEFGSNHLYIAPNLNLLPGAVSKKFSQTTLERLRGLPEAEGVIGISMRSLPVEAQHTRRILPVMFITLDNPRLVEKAYKFDSLLREGRFFQQRDEPGVIIGADVADKVFPQPLRVKQTIRIHGKPYKIIGIYSKLGTTDDLTLFPPYAIGKKTFNVTGYDMLDIVFREGTNIDALREKVKRIIKRTDGFTPLILTPEGLQNQVGGTITVATSFLSMLALVSLLISLISILNTYTAILEQRRREIGTLRSIGMSKWDVILLTMIEAGSIAFTASLLAILFSGGGIYLLILFARNAMPSLYFTFPVPILLFLLLGITLMSMLFSIIPAWLLQHNTTPIRLLKD